jgi:hypothetical protein
MGEEDWEGEGDGEAKGDKTRNTYKSIPMNNGR